MVRSVLGRTCPPPSADWLSLTPSRAIRTANATRAPAGPPRARGRFTRNFVVQASAADWALVLLAALRPGWPRSAPDQRAASWSSSSTTR